MRHKSSILTSEEKNLQFAICEKAVQDDGRFEIKESDEICKICKSRCPPCYLRGWFLLENLCFLWSLLLPLCWRGSIR